MEFLGTAVGGLGFSAAESTSAAETAYKVLQEDLSDGLAWLNGKLFDSGFEETVGKDAARALSALAENLTAKTLEKVKEDASLRIPTKPAT